MFNDNFKKDLSTIQAEPDLLSRTRRKMTEVRIRTSRAEEDHSAARARHLGGRNRIRIAVAVLCPVLIVSAFAYFWATNRNTSDSKVTSGITMQAAEQTTSTLSEDDADAGFQDSDIHCFTNYSSILKILERTWENASQGYSFDNGLLKTEETATTTAAVADLDSEGMSPVLNPSDSGDSNYSQTNVQVEGVDEADVIKNDGEYLYCIVGVNLYVIDVRNPEDMKVLVVLNSVNLDIYESFIDIFYDSDTKTLSVLSGAYYGYSVYYSEPDTQIGSDSFNNAESSDAARYYGNCSPAESYTKLETYDVSDPSSPAPIRTFAQEGSYVSSRRIGDTVYLVTSQYIWYDSSARAEDLLPCTSSEENTWMTVPAKNIYIVNPDYADTYTIVSAIDSRNAENAATTQAVVGTGNIVYASQDTLYVAGTICDSFVNGTETDSLISYDDIYKTKILSFSITDGGLEAKASGTVQGTLLNQYSMDEYQGYLRIATTSGGWSTDSSNNIVVLDKSLEEVSSLTGLAPGEQIYSARFAGDRIYLVTFVQVDPLFVIDASDPTDLKVLGELKIPGYSNYLQMIGDNLVLAIGNATRTEGENVIPAGLKIAVFDVTDPENPVVQSSLVYGETYGYSEVQYNPKALLLDLSRGLVGLPVSFDKNAGKYGSDYVDGFLLLHIDDQGNLTHEYLFDEMLYSYGSSRGVYIDDALFLIGSAEITAYSLTDYSFLDSLSLESATYYE